MNSHELLNQLKKFSPEFINLSKLEVASESLEQFQIAKLTTNMQEADDQSVAFYQVSNTEHSKKLFEERYNLLKSKPALLVLNNSIDKKWLSSLNLNALALISAEDFLPLQKVLCDELYPNKNKLKLVGVTGTNGKTTTVNLCVQLAQLFQLKSLSLGTLGLQNADGLLLNLDSTTPSYVDLRKLIYRVQDEYDALFMEVSSHALVQKRLFDLKLEHAAFMSFSQDHLDYHHTLEEYFDAKMLIANVYLKQGGVLICPQAEKVLIQKINQTKNQNTFHFELAPTLNERKVLNPPLFYQSRYNQSNLEVAMLLVEKIIGQKIESIDLNLLKTPAGRFKIVEIGETAMAIIDYAHTPDALINIGAAIREAFPLHKLVTLFGCGGNRDKSKRPLMAKAVESFSDRVVITSDNPRDENPEDIILDIIKGMSKSYDAMIDRKEAIIQALDELDEGEILLIAGKGHEEYQEIKGVKYSFSDLQIVLDYKNQMELE